MMLKQATKAVSRRGVRQMGGCCHWFDPVEGNDDIWQVDFSSLKYGRGSLREVGDDAQAMQLKRVAVFTDRGQRNLPHLATVLESMDKFGVDYDVYDEVSIEPTDKSLEHAIQYAKEGRFDGFISLGGGSVIDTCKAANLYSTFETDLLAYVNAPIGRGELVPGPIKPHIACPTTSGTGSESTGLAIFDYSPLHAKTGIASRRIRPDLGVIDPDVTMTMPASVVACSGFDVLSHAAESYTARPFTSRAAPARAQNRPMSQGSNPWSDMGCATALQLTGEYMTRAVTDPSDHEARERMMFASTLAGIAFGNAGCHLPHGLSYSVSGLATDSFVDGYPRDKSLIPHGMSVILNAPSVFRFTAAACPDRHLAAAAFLGADTRGAGEEDAGEVLSARIVELMRATGQIPNGLQAVGYCSHDVERLVAGAVPQRRLLDNAPLHTSDADVGTIYEGAMTYW